MTEECFVPLEKIKNYLLDFESENGGSKAKFFMQAGFSLANIPIFIEALKNHYFNRTDCNEYASKHGQKREIEGSLQTPDGSRQVKTVLIYRDISASWQFVTAIPRPAPKPPEQLRKAGITLD